MSCGEIIPNIRTVDVGAGMCRIEEGHLSGVVIDESGIIQRVPPGGDQTLVGLPVGQCDHNAAVTYSRVDYRDSDGNWQTITGDDIRNVSGEVGGFTPAAGAHQGDPNSSYAVLINAYADGASLCIETRQPANLYSSLQRLVAPIYGHSDRCEQLFSSDASLMCEIFVPAVQSVYNSIPEAQRDHAEAPQSFLSEWGAWLLAGIGSVVSSVIGVEYVGHIFGVRVGWWTRLSEIRQIRGAFRIAEATRGSALAAETAYAAEVNGAGSGATVTETVAGQTTRTAASRTGASAVSRFFTGAANLLMNLGSRLVTPIFMIDTCGMDEVDPQYQTCVGGPGPLA